MNWNHNFLFKIYPEAGTFVLALFSQKEGKYQGKSAAENAPRKLDATSDKEKEKLREREKLESLELN